MKVLALRNCWVGDQLIEEGKSYDLSEKSARDLIRIGRAVEAPAEECKVRSPRKAKADDAK